MLSITKRTSDGTVTTHATGYTVESNLQPHMTGFNKFMKKVAHFPIDFMILNRYSNYSYRDSFLQTLRLFTGFVFPFENHSILLKDGTSQSKYTDGSNTVGKYGILGGADYMTAYSGESTVRGTINKAESYIKYEGFNKKVHHFVYDFPTHAVNNVEIKEIEFKPLPTFEKSGFFAEDAGLDYVKNGDSLPALKVDDLLAVCGASGYYNDFIANSNLVAQAPGHTDSYFVAPNGDFIIRNEYCKIGDYQGKFTHSMSASYTTPVFFNNSWYFFPKPEDNYFTNSGNRPLSYYVVTEFRKGDNGVLEAVTERRTSTLEFSSYNTSIGLRVNMAVPWGDNLLLVCHYDYNNTSYYKYVNFVLLDSSLQLVKSIEDSSGLMSKIGGSNAYLYQSIYNAEDDTYIIGGVNPYSTSPNIKLNKDLSFVEVANVFPSKDSNASAYGQMRVFYNNPKVYAMIGASSTRVPSSNTVPKWLVQGEIIPFTIKFVLDNPIVKTADETLKLTFDITIEV